MTWSYNTALATLKDQVRFLVGDTDTTQQLVSDEEITGFVAIDCPGTTDPYIAGAAIARAIAGKFARKADRTVGDLRVSSSQQAAAYRAMAKDLTARAARSGFTPTPYAGGQSVGEKLSDDIDTNLPQPSFRVGMDDFLGPFDNNDDDSVFGT